MALKIRNKRKCVNCKIFKIASFSQFKQFKKLLNSVWKFLQLLQMPKSNMLIYTCILFLLIVYNCWMQV